MKFKRVWIKFNKKSFEIHSYINHHLFMQSQKYR